MGFLDTVIGSLMGGGAGGSSPMGGILSGLLGGGGQAGGLPGQGTGGGFGGLVSQFGLGHVAQSWVSNDPNQPVSPQQLQSVSGDSQIQGMASQAGMQPHGFRFQLSRHLPNAMHGMTPNGRVSGEGTMSV